MSDFEKKFEKLAPYFQKVLDKADPKPIVCPICKGTKHLPLPEVLQLHVGLFVKEGEERVKGSYVETIALHCENCGHIELFAIKKD